MVILHTPSCSTLAINLEAKLSTSFSPVSQQANPKAPQRRVQSEVAGLQDHTILPTLIRNVSLLLFERLSHMAKQSGKLLPLCAIRELCYTTEHLAMVIPKEILWRYIEGRLLQNYW